MKTESHDSDRRSSKAAVLRTVGLAVSLGVATWLLVPLLLPVKLPEDFPKLPDLRQLNPDFRAALQTADQEARRRPGSAAAVGKLGMVYHANLLFGEAARAYRIAARLAPREYRWAYGQALLQEETGEEKEQFKALQTTLRLEPDHLPALLKLADWLIKADRLDEAAQHYETAARMPDGAASLQAGYGLGRVAARRREWNQVIERIAPVTNSYPEAAPLYKLLQEAYQALGQADKAAAAGQIGASAKWKTLPPLDDAFNEQLISLSYSSTRLLKQAGLLSRVGYPDRAIAVGRRAVQVAPADPDVRNFVARTLLTFHGDKPEAIDEALTHLSECLRLKPDDPVPLGGFANDFFKTPKPPATVARLQGLLRSRPEIPGAHYFLGMAADALGETDEAIAQYRAALKENPRNSAVYNKLGLILENTGKPGEAIAQFQRAIQLNPANTDARLNLAIELIQRGKYSQGVRELDELLRISPHDAAAHFCMGFAFLSLKRIDEAIARFRQGLLYKPNDAEARFGLGSALAAQGKREEALVEVREALRLRPNHGPARQLLLQLETGTPRAHP